MLKILWFPKLFQFCPQFLTATLRGRFIWGKLFCLREKAMAPHSSTLAWKTPGWRSLEGCSPWGCWGSDKTERLHFHFSLSCIGDGNGNPLQCSCLENPRDRGAWWAAVNGVAQSRTRLKWLSRSSRWHKWNPEKENSWQNSPQPKERTTGNSNLQKRSESLKNIFLKV